MFDHVGINVSEYERSRSFYEQALAPLGYGIAMQFDEHKAVAFGPAGKPALWIVERQPVGTATHLAFTTPDRVTVDAFHAAAVAAGGTDNGSPGLRPYHENYYGAFVLDPDGNNVEAVFHG